MHFVLQVITWSNHVGLWSAIDRSRGYCSGRPHPVDQTMSWFAEFLGFPVTTATLGQLVRGNFPLFDRVLESSLLLGSAISLLFCALTSFVWVVAARMLLRVALKEINKKRNRPTTGCTLSHVPREK
jgi:hypothetical protein